MYKKILRIGLFVFCICSLAACGTAGYQDAKSAGSSTYESVEGTQIKMLTENT